MKEKKITCKVVGRAEKRKEEYSKVRSKNNKTPKNCVYI